MKIERLRSPQDYVEHGEAPTLTADQQRVVDAVIAAAGSFQTLLLQGVTAAGKTEVYLRTIEEVLARGKGALVLVPEISLTHQVVARFRARFGDSVAVLHSDLTPGERWDEWRRIARGQARIAVGARSAVLAPMSIARPHHRRRRARRLVQAGRRRPLPRARHRRDARQPRRLPGGARLGDAFARKLAPRRRRPLPAPALPNRVTPCPPPRIEVIDLRGKDIDAGGGLSPRR